MQEAPSGGNDQSTQRAMDICYAVKRHPCLYDTQSPDFSNKEAVKDAWKDVAKECNETVGKCRFTWRTITNGLQRCLRRYGDPSNYYLHKHLNFLLPFMEPHAKGSDDSNNQTEDGNESVSFRKANGQNDNHISDSDTPSMEEVPLAARLKVKRSRSTREQKPQPQPMPPPAETAPKATAAQQRRSLTVTFTAAEGDEPVRTRERKTPKRFLDPLEQPAQSSRRVMQRRKSVAGHALNEYAFQDSVSVFPLPGQFDVLSNLEPKIIPDLVPSALPLQPKLEGTAGSLKIAGPIIQRHLVDSSTDTKFLLETCSVATQSEELPRHPDDEFLHSLKPELEVMNLRQKVNFKRRVYQALMEVLDDGKNFPNDEEIMETSSSLSEELKDSTSSELRLMRELVSLVQASKTTVELTQPPPPPKRRRMVQEANKAQEPKKTIEANKSAEPSQTDQTTATVAAAVAEISKVEEAIKRQAASKASPVVLTPKTNVPSSFASSPTMPAPPTTTRASPAPGAPALAPLSIAPALRGASSVFQNGTRGNSMLSSAEQQALSRQAIENAVKIGRINNTTILTKEGDKRRIYRIYSKALSQPNTQQKSPSGATSSMVPTSPSSSQTPIRIPPKSNSSGQMLPTSPSAGAQTNTTGGPKYRIVPMASNATRQPRDNIVGLPSTSPHMMPPLPTRSPIQSNGIIGQASTPNQRPVPPVPRQVFQRRYSVCGPPSARITVNGLPRPSHGPIPLMSQQVVSSQQHLSPQIRSALLQQQQNGVHRTPPSIAGGGIHISKDLATAPPYRLMTPPFKPPIVERRIPKDPLEIVPTPILASPKPQQLPQPPAPPQYSAASTTAANSGGSRYLGQTAGTIAADNLTLFGGGPIKIELDDT